MIESTAYFESYYHVLKKIKQMDKWDYVPFEEYLTGHNKDFIRLPAIYEELEEYQQVQFNQKIVEGINTAKLDNNQAKAMNACLKKELALIQGPPGTGKTYVGEHFVKILIDNKKFWRENKGPILIVCYTNHALDQFLNLISKYTMNFVRIGGRSQDESLKNHSIQQYIKDRKISYPKSYKYAFEGYQKKDYTKALQHFTETLLVEPDLPVLFWLGLIDLDKYIQDLIPQIVLSQQHQMFEQDLYYNLDDLNQREKEYEEILDQKDIYYSKSDAQYYEKKYFNLTQLYKQQTQSDFFFKQGNMMQCIQSGQQIGKAGKLAERDYPLFNLRMERRWQLNNYYADNQDISQFQELHQLIEEYKIKFQRRQELQSIVTCKALKQADIVAMTTTGCAKNSDMMKDINFPIVIVEEAAEVFEAHILTALSQKTEHLILIGDHQQLRPSPAVYELEKTYNLDMSMFERLVKNKFEYTTLSNQRRMRPEISNMVRFLYPELTDDPKVKNYPNIKGVDKNVFFMHHEELEQEDEGLSSKLNKFEAELIINYANYLIQQNYQPNQITILSLYQAQSFYIKKQIRQNYLDITHPLNRIKIITVDNFQGEENDIIILSLKLNKEVIFKMFQKEDALIIVIQDYPVDINARGYAIILKQMKQIKQAMIMINVSSHAKEQIHVVMNAITNVLSARIFYLIAKQKFKSKYRSVDMQTKLNALKAKIYNAKMIAKKLRTVVTDARKSVTTIVLQTNVELMFPKFYLHASMKQRLNVLSVLKNSSKMVIFLSIITTLDGCYIKCGQILECGHPCAEKCGTCQKKFFHGFCDQKCNRTLFCGHICKDNCAKECSACEAKCETKCAHSKCQQKCYYPCKQCIEPCEIGCIHSKCSKKCHEPCDRQICNEPCPLKLKCEHDCIGLCGDICPQVCRICNKDDETFTIFFGLEDEPDSRFVQIDCGHIFESQQLDRWVNKTEESSDDQEESKQQNNEQNNNSQSSFIKFPECPKCKQLIRKSQRYQNRINQVLNDINVLKSKVESQTENLKKKVEQMQDTYKQFHQKKLECDNKFIQEIQTLLSQWFSMFNQFKQNPVVLQNLERKLILIQIFISCQKYLSQQGWGMVSQNLTLQMQCNEFLRVIKKNKFIIDDNEFESYKKLAEQIDQSIDFKQLVKQLGDAIGISGGRWFKCKNGHFYAIGECGGAMEESRCPECKEVIGGKDHQLAEGNQFASEIDSESRPAWDPQGFNQRVLNGQIDLRQIIHD
ncbi:UNKNOWN [Stylonychia lemnae]|uniref:RZ-type domain-containing protein n=1 Tax=Stylonychia lemnae TaxID=5949 RepID=A0A078B6T2_STYLE|nr:UNKNOWN [Stylonychia lemnae]|eukprot:CDW90094.1 UNKNOWN [Stylonychia lemnae]